MCVCIYIYIYIYIYVCIYMYIHLGRGCSRKEYTCILIRTIAGSAWPVLTWKKKRVFAFVLGRGYRGNGCALLSIRPLQDIVITNIVWCLSYKR